MIALLLLSIFSFNSFSQELDLTQKLVARNELTLKTIKLKPYLYDDQVSERLDSWLNHPTNLEYSVECQYKLRPFFPIPKILSNLCYFMRNEDPQKRLMGLDFINFAIDSNKSALLEISADPRYSFEEKNKANNILNIYKSHSPEKIATCFNPVFKVDWKKAINSAGKMAYSPFQAAIVCLRSLPSYPFKLFLNGQWANIKMPYFSLNLTNEFLNHPGHVISQTGWIPGNKVTYLNTTPSNDELFHLLKPKAFLVRNLYPLNGNGQLNYFYSKRPEQVFTKEEGFFTPENDPVWNANTGIFYELKQAILKADDTIFIDIFFLGGTVGVSLAKLLIQQMEKKPNLKILILRDNINHLTFEKDMKPVFNFLLAYSLKHPKQLVISPSHINSHKSGLPSYLSSYINEDWLQLVGINTSMKESLSPVHVGVKSDHSKVMVVDAKGPNPLAFVGSKNWIDASGSICHDDVAMVTGPAALVIQDDYYFDMFYALRFEINETTIDRWASQGWSNNLYQPSQVLNQKIINILKPFDLLNRNEKAVANPIQKIMTPIKGNTTLRTGMNNVDSTVMSALDQNIQAILFAKKRIFINDQYVFDRNIINALLIAKRKNPTLEIKLIMEPVVDSPIPGMPNLLYADLLAKEGIQIKLKNKTTGDLEIRQDFHMKTLSVDGQYVIVGSANKDFNTMYGAFREEQLDIFDPKATTVHDQLFIERWSNPYETSEIFTQYKFTLPSSLKGVDGKTLTPEHFVSLLRSAISILFDFTTHGM